MKHEDAFSKLFSDARNIEETPPADLWSRLEARLDAGMPVSDPKRSGKGGQGGRLLSFSRRWLAAAASIAALTVAAVGIVKLTSNQDNKDVLAMVEHSDERSPALEELPLDANLPMTALTESEQARLLARQDKAQAEVLLKDGKVASDDKMSGANSILKVEKNLSLKENLRGVDDIITIEIEPRRHNAVTMTTASTAFSAAGMTSKIADVPSDPASNEAYRQAPRDAYSEMNYSNYVPTVNAAELERLQSDAEYQNYKAKARAESKTNTRAEPVIQQRSNAVYNSISHDIARNEEDGTLQILHPKLQIFNWLIGNWKDDKQYEGTSYEEWTFKDKNTLAGKGYVVNTDKSAKLFQEFMRLEYRPDRKQVVLVLTLDDTGKELEYVFSGYELSSGEYLFLQSSQKNYPERVIFKKDESGNRFATIIVDKTDKKGTLTTEQQRYLDKRNHVSGTRAVRNLTRF